MSENSNIKVVRFIDGRKEGYGQALYAHDYGQKIRIEGLELPGNYEVHFSDVLGGAGVPRLATDNVVEVPRGYMHHPGNLYLWIYLNLGGSDGTTCYKATIPILPKADGYVEMTDEEQTIVDDMIASLNEASDRVEHAKDVLDQMQEIVDGVDAMPKAHYDAFDRVYNENAVIFYVPDINNPLYPSPSVRNQAANNLEIRFEVPVSYIPINGMPKENDLFLAKAMGDLSIPNGMRYNYFLFFIRLMHLDSAGGRHSEITSDLYPIYNIAYNYPVGTQMFDKNRVYILRFRKRTSDDPGWTYWPGHEYGFDILNYVPGEKAAQDKLDQAIDLIEHKAVRYDTEQELTETQQTRARDNIKAAGLDENGHVIASQLPSFVDDVLEGYVDPQEDPVETFYARREPVGSTYAYFNDYTPENGKIYVDLETGKTYRWSGTVYTEISQSLALGETSSTAFPGDRGLALEQGCEAVMEAAEAIDGNVARAETAAGDAVTAKDAAIQASTEAMNAVSSAGWMSIWIDDDGYLRYTRNENTDIELSLDANGYLVASIEE